ncbi:MAG: zinc-finger domain-containing protein [Alphaproteobacteria bacterium]
MPNDISQPRVTKPPEIVYVSTHRVACDGGAMGGGRSGLPASLGHPRVFLELGESDRVECPYCDRLFVLRADAKAGH